MPSPPHHRKECKQSLPPLQENRYVKLTIFAQCSVQTQRMILLLMCWSRPRHTFAHLHRFSAFWLRSSVVSVLISLTFAHLQLLCGSVCVKRLAHLQYILGSGSFVLTWLSKIASFCLFCCLQIKGDSWNCFQGIKACSCFW